MNFYFNFCICKSTSFSVVFLGKRREFSAQKIAGTVIM